MSQIPFTRVVAGREHAVGIAAGGVIMVWGSNHWGQLGLCSSVPRASGAAGVCYPGGATAEFDNSLVPTVVPVLSSLRIVDIAAGARHTIAVSSDGDVYAWGDNTQHQLGKLTDSHYN